LVVEKSRGGFHIPASLDEVTANLTGIERFITAKQYERAALVTAFTYTVGDIYHDPRQLRIFEFAELGIVGLTTPETVRFYRNAWAEAGGRLHIKPGDKVTLPTRPFPMRTSTKNDDTDIVIHRPGTQFIGGTRDWDTVRDEPVEDKVMLDSVLWSLEWEATRVVNGSVKLTALLADPAITLGKKDRKRLAEVQTQLETALGSVKAAQAERVK
jgi:hypothetical protein